MNRPMPSRSTQSDPTREIAFDLLTAVLDRKRTLEDALDRAGAAEPRDRAAAHRLAAAVLRRLGSLDAVLEPFLTRGPPDPVRHVLRLGAAGLLLLDTPAHAAVATAVALTRARRLASFSGLVNAVLRRVAEAGPVALKGLDGPRLDTPPWLWASWGPDARAIAEAHAHEAPLDLTLAPGAEPPSGQMLPTGSVRFPPGTRVQELPGYAEGKFWVQDAAAALPASLLAAKPGEHVADLCAAPGGKTAQLAATGAHVFAVERDPARMRRLHENPRPPQPAGRSCAGRCDRMAPPPPHSTPYCSMPPAARLARSAGIPTFLACAAPATSPNSRPGRTACSPPPPRCSGPAAG